MTEITEERLWHKNYMLGPYKLAKTLRPYPKVPLYSILDDSAASYPYKAAIDYEGSRIRYKELKLMADSLANALLGMGVGKGKSVVVYLPNCPQYIIGDFAILKAGAFTTPISPLHKAGEVEYQLNKCGAETIICLEEDLELFESMKDKTNLQNIIVTDIGDYADKGAAAQTKTAPGTHRFVDLITEHEGDPPPPDPGIDPTEDLAYLAFTGGSTGIPKGVMLTHSARYCNVMQGLPWVYSPLMGGIKGKSSVIIPVPLFHIYGHWVLHSAMYMGLRIILLPDPRNMDKLVELMQRNRPLLVCVVPTQLMRLVGKKIGRMPVTIMSGAAPLPSQVADDIGEELKMPISEGYGLTETGPVTHMNVSSFSKVTGFMRMFKRGIGIPIPDTEVKLVDPGTGEDIGFDEEGELYLRGPQLMKGYWPTPGDGLTDDGWVTTGDVAKVDEDGYFYIVDRVKDMANISGYKVYTTVVDEVLFTHPAVSMAVSIGVPDPERAGSERIKAFIRVKDDYEGEIKTEDLIEHCREKLPPYAIPKFIEFNDDLPLTVTEKLFKRALREKEVQKMKEKGELG